MLSLLDVPQSVPPLAMAAARTAIPLLGLGDVLRVASSLAALVNWSERLGRVSAPEAVEAGNAAEDAAAALPTVAGKGATTLPAAASTAEAAGSSVEGGGGRLWGRGLAFPGSGGGGCADSGVGEAGGGWAPSWGEDGRCGGGSGSNSGVGGRSGGVMTTKPECEDVGDLLAALSEAGRAANVPEERAPVAGLSPTRASSSPSGAAASFSPILAR